ncbi:treslin isoform X1 [Alligator mississippiensis]|uniref:treslin isoform X1 n=1 Tax=Alligator mississippiensis TaxID=8496 RepID=UPI002877E123|nr:treslin isoform X1 [Alligator mississippiensis]
MPRAHNVVLLLDTASPAPKQQLQLGSLRILNYLGCKFGLAKVRWGFKFFDSLGSRGRASRVGDFRELGPRSWEDFEEELETRFGMQSCKSHLPGPVPRALITQTVLKETLLDYQWDRPEITSPTKPVLRSQKSKLLVAPDEPLESHMPSEGFVNLIFLFSPCPHSQRELLQFVSGNEVRSCCELPTPQEVAEKLLPRRVREMITGQKIALYWVDTAERYKLLESPDHVGYWTMAELICPVGGTIFPSETLIACLGHHRTDIPGFPGECRSSKPQFIPWTSSILPFDSTLSCLLSKPSVFQASFPQQKGVLFLSMHGVEKQWSCEVILEPLVMNQRYFRSPVNIFLKGSLTDWNLTQAGSFLTESWILQSSQAGQSVEDALFQQLVKRLTTEELYLVAEVSASEAWSSCTGVLSPLSDSAAVLTVFCSEKTAEVQRCLLQGTVAENSSQDYSFDLPDIVSSVLSEIDSLTEDNLPSSGETPVPEWVQQELSRTGGWSPAVVEGWYPLSNVCGASSDLMESFRLLQAVSVGEKEEVSQPEAELTNCLSEFYQRKSGEASVPSGPRDYKKRRGVPRTPVRQKMKTMSRSLQMLNVARLNVKAQKFQPDCAPPAAGEKVPQRLSVKRSDDKLEERGRALKIPKDFKTEDELLSHLTASHQKAVTEGDVLLCACAQNMVLAIKRFLKIQDAPEKEVACVDRVRSRLLKTSKALRQEYGTNPDKENKVRECQLQIFLRLEMCLQYPFLQNSTDEMEQLVEEMTEMLRILCLAEDPGYLTKFLEEVLALYMDSIPRILGNLYYSLGTQIPTKLASVLPADFFSDDSMTMDSKSPTHPQSLPSAPAPSTETEQLEELRTRSAKKRRNSALARHRSMTEMSQNLRQVEMPQIPKNPIRKENSRSYLAAEKPKQMPVLQKEAAQEVTKVRRNLFNEDMLSPSKRSLKKMPRSQSVSAVEGVKHKRSYSDEGTRDHRTLLTKRVAETPLHKQISRRLLHKQIKGRSSDPGSDISVVEESPEKTMSDGGLRRSPRIKQLSLNRTHSGFFYSTTQSNSQNMQRVRLGQQEESSIHQDLDITLHPNNPTIQSPKRLFFGAVIDISSPTVKDLPGTRRTRHNSFDLEKPVSFQTPRKTPRKATQKPLSSSSKMSRKSPRALCRTPKSLEKAPGKGPAVKQSVAKCLGKFYSPSRHKDKSPPELNKRRRHCLVQITPGKDCSPEKRLPTPHKKVRLQTTREQAVDGVLDASGSPLKDSSPCTATQFSSPVQEKFTTDLQTPRRSLRSTQNSASPAGPKRQILETETQGNPESNITLEPVPQEVERTPRKFRCTPARQSRSPVSVPLSPKSASKMQQESNYSPLDSSIKALATGALKSPNAIRTSPRKALRSLLHDPEQAKCKTKSGEENIALLPAKASGNEKQYSNANVRPSAESNWIFKASGNIPMVERKELVGLEAQGSSPRERQKSLEESASFSPSAKEQVHSLDIVEMHEQLESSSVSTNTRASLPSEPQAGQSQDLPETTVLPTGEFKQQRPFTHKRRSSSGLTVLSSTPTSASPAYALRCTADRRQREAAARLRNPEIPARFCTPNSPHHMGPVSPTAYEVELEMQASGLPKLHIKKIGSCSPLEGQPETKAGKPEEEESLVNDLTVACCSRHPGKLAASCVSPSCFRSSHTTPGKGGRQTYICHSYTPTICASTTPSHVDATPTSASSAYALRCTADRRQREAAARLRNPEIPARFSTPNIPHHMASASPTAYEVELEMQASGLPKLRIKKIGSCSPLEGQPETKAGKPKEEESPVNDLTVTWCSRHPGKLAASCVSPSCFRSSHTTPGKGGGQTYICQSYTPTSCASTTPSPSRVDAGVPWTPSPKYKGKTTPDAIKDWPRKKKAVGHNTNAGCGPIEKSMDCVGSLSTGEEARISDYNSKASHLVDFELEGVYKLQDQSPPGDSEPRAPESTSLDVLGLTSRKRAFQHLSPHGQTRQEAKKSCTSNADPDWVCSPTDETSRKGTCTVLPGRTRASSNGAQVQQSSVGDDEVFLSSGLTPPVKSSLSASGLRALTQSPLLYQGQTPPSWRKCTGDDNLDVFPGAAEQEVSPFHSMAFQRRPLGRTYSRKRLLS